MPNIMFNKKFWCCQTPEYFDNTGSPLEFTCKLKKLYCILTVREMHWFINISQYNVIICSQYFSAKGYSDIPATMYSIWQISRLGKHGNNTYRFTCGSWGNDRGWRRWLVTGNILHGNMLTDLHIYPQSFRENNGNNKYCKFAECCWKRN